MGYRHQEALTKSVMLEHASQTSGVMQSVHDKPCILPDTDIFASDQRLPRNAAADPKPVLQPAGRALRNCGRRGGCAKRCSCIVCKSIVLVLIAVMQDKFPFQAESA